MSVNRKWNSLFRVQKQAAEHFELAIMKSLGKQIGNVLLRTNVSNQTLLVANALLDIMEMNQEMAELPINDRRFHLLDRDLVVFINN